MTTKTIIFLFVGRNTGDQNKKKFENISNFYFSKKFVCLDFISFCPKFLNEEFLSVFILQPCKNVFWVKLTPLQTEA